MNRSEVFRAVLGSPVWADEIGTLDDWIEPTEQPDATTLAQLREICAAEPRIAEAWIHGSQTFGRDGNLRDTTRIAFVFDPPLGEADADARLDGIFKFTRALTECWPLLPGGQRGYGTATKAVLDTHAEFCVEVFRREAPG